MNVVDRIFLVVVFAVSILFFGSGYNVLDLVSLSDYVLVAVVLIVCWQILSVSWCKVVEFFSKSVDDVVVNRSIDIIPIIDQNLENRKLRRFKECSVEEQVDNL